MASFLSDVKKQAAKGIGRSLAKTGIIGAAVGKAFGKKFGSGEEEDTQVADALKEQGSLQSDNSAVLTRIESVAMNIADNVYNLAAVMNAHVTSMKEAQRLQQEKAFKDSAASEEAAAEATKVSAPAAAATEGADKKDKGGIMSSILGSIKGTKNMFKGFLKKFGVVAIGLAATLGVAAQAMQVDNEKSDIEDKTEQPTEPPTGPDASEPPTRVDAPPSETPSSLMTNVAAGTGGAGGRTTMDNDPRMSTSAPASTAAPALAAPPPPAAATAQDLGDKKTQEYLQQPANSAELKAVTTSADKVTSLETRIKYIKQQMSSAPTPAAKAGFQTDLDQLEPMLEIAKKEKSNLIQAAQKNATAAVPSGSTIAAPAGGALPSSSESGAMTGGGGAAGGGAAVSVPPPAPSTGADVGSASASVAAANEPQQPKHENVNVDSSQDTGTPPQSAMPSPSADRGSLDYGTTFDSGG